VKIPCIYWSKISKAKAPTLKKIAASAADSEDGEAGTVKRDTTYRNPEDPDVELGPEEKVKGYKYGPQYVPVTAVEEDMFKLKSPCSVTLIGSVPAGSIPRHHFLEGPLFLQGAVDNDAAQVSIVALSRTLRETGRALLVRFVKRENADPFLAALLPSDQG
jgi:ATP-dependent DNA helicase 2 subunit 2